MSETIVVNALEQLKPFLNDRGVLELVVRDQKQKYKAFQNIMINELPKVQENEMYANVIQALNKNTNLNVQNLKQLEHIANLSNVGLLLNGLNLCATCAGFAIMYAKLDKMSREINQQIAALQESVKDMHDIQTGFKFNEIIAEHRDMLDRKKIQKPYSEEQMRKLIDGEYNVLRMLIEVFEKDVSNDNRQLIFSIISLASMLTAAIIDFDEMYYFNNKEAIDNGEYWHSAHDEWTGTFQILSSPWFIEKLQDHALLKLNLDTVGVDAFYEGILDQIEDMEQEIEDNQALILAIDDNDLLRSLREYNAQAVIDNIEATIKDVAAEAEDPVFDKAYGKAMQMMA